jgi:DNA-binding GntR family transcriptional regulator
MAERVWLQLASEIVCGGVAGGRRLDEVEQSQRLGVSRTPLRESLRQLAALGLVENRPHRGVVVADGVGHSLFQVLAELEAACARTTAGVLDPEQQAFLARMDASHDVLLPWLRRSCGNSVLRGLLKTLWFPLYGAGVVDLGAAGKFALSRLRDAVAAGDGDGASQAARDYVMMWCGYMLSSTSPTAARGQ